MKKIYKYITVIAVSTMLLSSCTTINKSMKHPNVRVELNKNDFTLSDQVSAEAKSTRIVGIDFERLFTQKTGNISGGSTSISLASLPVVGEFLTDKTSNYALYNLMNSNPGFDVVFYPQYEIKVVKPVLGLGFITTITTAKTTARLGKLKK
ncbi:hypothetical protein OAN98_05505 [Bacteroidia bacterium]|nr:hypothetical protein [Bacteroidia bacterium]